MSSLYKFTLNKSILAVMTVAVAGGLSSACSGADTRYDVPDEVRNFPALGMKGPVTAAKLPTPTHDDLIEGAAVWDSNCRVCHGAGIAGAPKITNGNNWNKRLGQDIEVIFDHAINGFQPYAGGNMPPKGGNTSLSDEEVKNAVRYMLFNSGGADMVIENLKTKDQSEG